MLKFSYCTEITHRSNQFSGFDQAEHIASDYRALRSLRGIVHNK